MKKQPVRNLGLTLLFATVAGALTFGAAASLPVSSQNLGSGGVGVVSCDTDGVEVSYDLIPGEPQLVNGVTVSGIDAGCLGQTLSYVISDTASVSLATGSGTVSGATASFPLPVDLLAEQIGEVGITIAG